MPPGDDWTYMTPSTRRISVGTPMPVRSIDICIAGCSPVRSIAPLALTVWPARSVVMDTLTVVMSESPDRTRASSFVGEMSCFAGLVGAEEWDAGGREGA